MCVCANVYLCVDVRVYVCLNIVCLRMHGCVCACTYVRLRMYACMYVCMYVCMHVCMYIRSSIGTEQSRATWAYAYAHICACIYASCLLFCVLAKANFVVDLFFA